MDNFEKCLELGLLNRSEKGYNITEKWQKKIWEALSVEAKRWHKNGRKGNIDLFGMIESLVVKEFPKLDPLVEVEISYYLTSVANISLNNKLAEKSVTEK